MQKRVIVLIICADSMSCELDTGITYFRGEIGKFLPFSYGNVVGCMQGLYNRTMLQGILVLVCIDIILYVISYVAFRKRDIIC